MNDFLTVFLGATTLEVIASSSGFLCLFLLIKRNIWCWFFGFIQVSLYTWIFFHAKLYSDSLLHVIYMGLQVYGWWNWKHHYNQNNELQINTARAGFVALWLGIGITGTLFLGTLMHQLTDASMPYPDAFTTAMSLVAQWLLTQRYLVNWLFWIAVDCVAIGIYTQKALYPTAVLYFTFLVMCIIGYRDWRKQAQQLSSAYF